LDFAFEIHTDIGMSTLGAKVNGKLVPLSYEIQSGDQVQVLTSEAQRPQPDWENWVVTPKAKSKIRQYLRDHQRDAQDRGKRLLQRALKKAKSELNQSTTQKCSISSAYAIPRSSTNALVQANLAPSTSAVSFKRNPAASTNICVAVSVRRAQR
ncbi:MAG: bifunctional (p)ppGpp synthetase/guanosine-3',5'-bis(diphosphate) 3'-pyrophosphohydrolase, partial [Flavobacteriia bacterium]|nr:bifunctional (p)ppGpp synthetase/guanosine-3',5'-bis(diphosphate) 3'-pyrophosphohydrolase [Flavobacteriia bacterium]